MAKVLLGFMGAGKSTIARGLDPDFVDMDALLEERLGMSIARFFEEKGEEVISEKQRETNEWIPATRCVVRNDRERG